MLDDFLKISRPNKITSYNRNILDPCLFVVYLNHEK